MKTVMRFNEQGQLIEIAGICKARDFKSNTPRRENHFPTAPTVNESTTFTRRGGFFYDVEEVLNGR